ncbi:MAG: small ribosomal subunit biogenesis GTPase RsgA [Synechocystis sp.]
MSKATDDGTVIAIQANYYWVRLDQFPKTPLLCTRRTRLKKIGQKVMVGDLVKVELPPSLTPLVKQGQQSINFADFAEGDLGASAKLYPRRSVLERPPVANAEQICLVFSLADPPLDVWQLSRFLVQAEATGLKVILCLNKRDLVDSKAIAHWQDRLQGWGYDPVLVSVHNSEGLEPLRHRLEQGTSLMAGPSGVGKSSLLNALVPGIEQRVKQVSGKLRKGRHTTRHVELFTLPNGGLLADTPGFNQPDLVIDGAKLIQLFPEVRHQVTTQSCFFKDCLHRGEPDCAVSSDWERYEHYLTFLAEALQQQTPEGQRDSEIGVKTKTGSDGQEYGEPKLEPKKYRRPSRRQTHQDLQEFYGEDGIERLREEAEEEEP